MGQELIKGLVTALVPPVRSLQQQRDSFASALAQARAALAGVSSELESTRESVRRLKAELEEKQRTIDVLSAAPPPAPVDTFHFMGCDIPIDLMNMTGGGPATFEAISNQHQANLRKWTGLEPTHSVLEIGCGIGRDAIPLTRVLTAGRYLGVDIIGRSIDWCTRNIAARHPNFRFVHYNVADDLHNAGGVTRTADIVLPLEGGSVDRIFLFSVFTHLFQQDVEHYLREFRRVLKPGGLVFATTFIYDDAILERARATNLTQFDLRFEHEVGDGCRINDLTFPLGAVAFTQDKWNEMLQNSGMRLTQPFLHGAWSGFYSDAVDGQDVAVLTPEG